MQINPADLSISTFNILKNAGATNSIGVQVTHIPTGIKAASATGRSQHQNRAIAFELLTNILNGYPQQLELF